MILAKVILAESKFREDILNTSSDPIVYNDVLETVDDIYLIHRQYKNYRLKCSKLISIIPMDDFNHVVQDDSRRTLLLINERMNNVQTEYKAFLKNMLA